MSTALGGSGACAQSGPSLRFFCNNGGFSSIRAPRASFSSSRDREMFCNLFPSSCFLSSSALVFAAKKIFQLPLPSLFSSSGVAGPNSLSLSACQKLSVSRSRLD